jgi:hypothetical protein
MKDRVPGVICFHMVEGTSTAKITEAVGINVERSSGILYIISLYLAENLGRSRS